MSHHTHAWITRPYGIMTRQSIDMLSRANALRLEYRLGNTAFLNGCRNRHDLPPPGCYIQIEAVVPSILLVIRRGEVPARPRSWLPRGHPLAPLSAERLGVRFRLPR